MNAYDQGYAARLDGITEEQGVMEWRRGFHRAQWDLDHNPDGSLKPFEPPGVLQEGFTCPGE